MSNINPVKKKTGLSREQKKQRTQKIIFSIIAIILIISWILTLVIQL